MRLPRKALKRAAAVLIGLAATSLLLEGMALLVYGEQPKFPRHVVGADFGIRINQPGAVYRHVSADISVEFRINSRGLREDAEIPYRKPDGQLRIVSLGDSFTVGYEVDVADCFSEVLERELRDRGIDTEVINAGVSGFSNAEEYAYLDREMLKYSPDVVLLSFFGNDLVDNQRAGLFQLDGTRLVEVRDRYVPLGGLGDFLNKNAAFGFLSERSNAFAIAKSRVRRLLKRRLEDQNRAHVADADRSTSESGSPTVEHQRRLAAAILEKIYSRCQEEGIPLVLMSIPSFRSDPDRLIEMFPTEEFPTQNRDGLRYLPSTELLQPFLGKEQLYWTRSHGHWTPRAHRIAGKALADIVVDLVGDR